MGMDLVPRSKTITDTVHYNWSGWGWVREHMSLWGVPTHQFDGVNDGNLISAKTCGLMAAAIEAHKDEYNEAFAGEFYGPDPATEHARILRASGGVRQL